MNILIPLLSKKENDEEFLDKAVKGAKRIVVLLVIDTGELSGEFGFATNEIRKGNMLLEEIKKIIGKKRKTAETFIEWGNTISTITNTAKIQNVNKIVLKKQDNQWFENILQEFKKEEIQVEII